jgi:polyphosphate glucokinase
MTTLVIDIGGTNIKVMLPSRPDPVKVPSGPSMTPAKMVKALREVTADWQFDNIAIGYPGPVSNGRPAREPHNLGRGWVRFDYQKALGKPVRIINDAAIQALGSYTGGNMLFLGLGTGLGAAMIRDGCVIPLEIAHMPYKKGKTYEEYLGEKGMKRLGKKKWREHVADVVEILRAGLVVDYVVLGGGNAKRIEQLPPRTKRGSNANALTGGIRLWDDGAIPLSVQRSGRPSRPAQPVTR